MGHRSKIAASVALAAIAALWAPAAGAAAGRSVASYTPPAVGLVDSHGREVVLAEAFGAPGAIVFQFMFTTCPASCPLLSATLRQLRARLPAGQELRLYSISIDPEHDTPERLAAYAERFGAGRGWTFLTGSRENVAAVQQAFDAWRDNKMRHQPLTFLRPAGAASWIRYEGFVEVDQLLAELEQPDPLELGRRIYREGLLPSGAALPATLRDLPIAGAAAACAGCHRRSGYGAIEGGELVPPLAGGALFGGPPPSRAELFRGLYLESQAATFPARIRAPRPRPAYDAASLATLLRSGRDPAGRQLSDGMPRYPIGAEDAALLAAYLRRLGAAPDPGVDGDTIDFATAIGPGDPEEAAAVLAVMEAYVARKNRELEGLAARPGHSLWHNDDFAPTWRRWRLEAWRLDGPPAGWAAQLERHYRERPVFALLGGRVDGPFAEVHRFCESRGLPCLFPLTPLPEVGEPPGAATFYLSRGLAGEAEVLAELLGRQPSAPRILAVSREGEPARTAAKTFAARIGEQAGRFFERRLEAGAPPPTGASWRQWLEETRPDAVVAWLAPADLAGFAELPAASAPPLYLSATLAGGLAAARQLGRPSFATWPASLPGREDPQIHRARAWLRSRGLAPGQDHEAAMLDTYFTLALADHALAAMAGRFSRELFVETIENETESAPNPGTYPRLSLGPGQRFASKGGYLLALRPGAAEPVDGWIVPR